MAGKQEKAHPLIAAIRALGPLQEPLPTTTPLKHLTSLPVPPLPYFRPLTAPFPP